MQTPHFDLAIIGAGTAGMSAYEAASKYLQRIAVVDPGPYGTLCARAGCMPSKLLVAAANAAHAARRAGRFGVQTGDVWIDTAAVMRRVHEERDRFVDTVAGHLDRAAHQIAAPTPEDEEMPGERILLQHRLGLRGQRREALAHVRDPGREPDPRVGRHRDHAVRPRISRAKASGS